MHPTIGCIFLKNIKLSKKEYKLIGKKRKKENILLRMLNTKVDLLNKTLAKNKLLEVSELLGNRKRLLWVNLISGISKGFGIGIGVTIITAILVIILQKIVSLNIPVIGEFVSDIVDIVQKK